MSPLQYSKFFLFNLPKTIPPTLWYDWLAHPSLTFSCRPNLFQLYSGHRLRFYRMSMCPYGNSKPLTPPHTRPARLVLFGTLPHSYTHLYTFIHIPFIITDTIKNTFSTVFFFSNKCFNWFSLLPTLMSTLIHRLDCNTNMAHKLLLIFLINK